MIVGILSVQTAHDQGYLVKHLLNGLPSVTERVKNMRQGRNNGTADDQKNRMFASQEAYIKVSALASFRSTMSTAVRTC